MPPALPCTLSGREEALPSVSSAPLAVLMKAVNLGASSCFKDLERRDVFVAFTYDCGLKKTVRSRERSQDPSHVASIGSNRPALGQSVCFNRNECFQKECLASYRVQAYPFLSKKK